MADQPTKLPFDFLIQADRLVLAAQLLSEVDLNYLLSEVNRADTLGPILDPTRYRDALNRGSMHAIARLAQSALQFSHEFQAVRDKVVRDENGL
jgi:hypothetical protein